MIQPWLFNLSHGEEDQQIIKPHRYQFANFRLDNWKICTKIPNFLSQLIYNWN
jgi:hypothetical protein